LFINVDDQKEELKETLFEHALKRISIQAFDALLTCGVRDLTGLLCLASEDLKNEGISSRITTELIGIQQQIKEQINQDRDCKDAVYGSNIKEKREHDNDLSLEKHVVKQATPIPSSLKENISTRAHNLLVREKIQTCERLLAFKEIGLLNLEGIGRKTVNEIKQLQDNIVQIHPELRHILIKTIQHKKPRFDDRPNFPKLDTYPSRYGEHGLLTLRTGVFCLVLFRNCSGLHFPVTLA
jgi:hypothetical protein